jgi:S-adenosylmethionine synthetase
MENLILNDMKNPTADELEAEIVERKGLGHPDTICDSLAEELTRSLCRLYMEKFGTILHHNVDKILLSGGASQPRFGGGEVTAPIEIFLVGRATKEYKGVSLPLGELAQETVREWFGRNIPALDPLLDLKIHCLWRPTSPDLTDLFIRSREPPGALANDTSIGVGFAPLSPLESLVLAVERQINAPWTKERHPEYGADVKVMGTRRKDRMRLTIPCAFVARHVLDREDYLGKKRRLASLIQQWSMPFSPEETLVEVNTADSGESLYLTVTGTSAEAGDDGEVGRGNRINGLITPYRPMTMEAFAGKNPVTHTGKLYQIAAQKISNGLTLLEGVKAAECFLVSQIGMPIRQPHLIDVRLKTARGRKASTLHRQVSAVVRQELEGLSDLWKEFASGRQQGEDRETVPP